MSFSRLTYLAVIAVAWPWLIGIGGAQAAITPTGDITPTYNGTDPWDVGGELTVGDTGAGSLTIGGGSRVNSGRGIVGKAAGAFGTVTVTDPNSIWTPTHLTVGEDGGGTVNILNGAKVSATTTLIGFDHTYNSSCTVNVIGPGSELSTSLLTVPGAGYGTLNITEGTVNVSGDTVVRDSGVGDINFDRGTLNTGGLFAPKYELLGIGTINTRGMIGDVDLIFGSGTGLQQHLHLSEYFGQSIEINIDMSVPTANRALGAGYVGTGSLRIADGILVESSSGSLGHEGFSKGSAVVTGPGSHWKIAETIGVGRFGSGDLRIEAGAKLTNKDAKFGEGIDGKGSALVTGFGSQWETTRSMLIGNTGVGELRVEASGKVISGSARIANSFSSTGTATVTGAGSAWEISSNLEIGPGGVGRLNILDGGVVTVSSTTTVGSSYSDGGAINFAGGTLNSKYLVAAASKLQGVGTINVKGFTSDYDVAFDATTGLKPTVLLNDLPGQDITVNVDVTPEGSFIVESFPLVAGYQGTGNLRIAGGVDVPTSSAILGFNTGSTGTATVTGHGSTWTCGGLDVGRYGQGDLRVEAGAKIIGGSSNVGRFDGSSGVATITGPGSTWTNSGSLEVGVNSNPISPSGEGIVNVFNGALVTVRSSINVDADSSINLKTGGMLAKRSPPGHDGSLADFMNLIDGSDAINYWDGTGWSSITNAIYGVDYTIDYRSIGGPGYVVLTVGQMIEGDFDGDEDVDGDDFLAWQLGNSPNSMSSADLAKWESEYGDLPLVEGDFDGDSDVDGRDFLVWQRGGSPNPHSAGDLAKWEGGYGAAHQLSASVAVPEPASVLLFGVGPLLALRRARVR